MYDTQICPYILPGISSSIKLSRGSCPFYYTGWLLWEADYFLFHFNLQQEIIYQLLEAWTGRPLNSGLTLYQYSYII